MRICRKSDFKELNFDQVETWDNDKKCWAVVDVKTDTVIMFRDEDGGDEELILEKPMLRMIRTAE